MSIVFLRDYFMKILILFILMFLTSCSFILPTEYRKESVEIDMVEVKSLLQDGFEFKVFDGKVVLIKNTGTSIIVKDVFIVFQKE